MPFGEARTLGFNNEAVSKLIAGAVTLDKTGLTVKNAFGATIFKVEVSKDAWFLYKDTGSATQGALIANGAAGAGTDDFGNSFLAGVVEYITVAAGLGAGRYAIALTDQNGPYGNNVALTIQNLSNLANIPPGLLSNIDSTDGSTILLNSGKKTAGATQSQLQLLDSILNGITTIVASADRVDIQPVVATAAIFEVNGYDILDSLTADPAASVNGATVWTDTNGFLRYRAASGSSDTTKWFTGHDTHFSTTDETVNSVTFATVCGSGAVVGPGKYRVHAELTGVQGPVADFNDYRLGFTGTISQVRMKMRSGQDATNMFLATTTSNNGLLRSHAWAIGSTYEATLHGVIVTTSSGTLSIQAACDTNAANTFKVLALSDFHVERIG